MKKNKLVWNAYLSDLNSKRIEPYNIFDHFGFMNGVIEANRKYSDDAEFVEKVRGELIHYYFSKTEWEIYIIPFIFSDARTSIKIDVFQQVEMNWNAFVEYLLAHRKDIRKTKMK